MHDNPKKIFEDMLGSGFPLEIDDSEPFRYMGKFAVINWPVILQKKYPNHLINLK